MAFLVMHLAGAAIVALERLPGVRFKRSQLFRPFFVSDAWYLISGYVAGTAGRRSVSGCHYEPARSTLLGTGTTRAATASAAMMAAST